MYIYNGVAGCGAGAHCDVAFRHSPHCTYHIMHIYVHIYTYIYIYIHIYIYTHLYIYNGFAGCGAGAHYNVALRHSPHCTCNRIHICIHIYIYIYIHIHLHMHIHTHIQRCPLQCCSPTFSSLYV